jgi:hypothetical protein
MTNQALGVYGIAIDVESRRQEPLELVRTKAGITKQIGMSRNPEGFLGSERGPAMGASCPSQKLERHCDLWTSEEAIKEG